MPNDSERIERLKEQVAALPTTPGVYRYLNSAGEVIYVGKAKNLRRRVSSYFVSRHDHSAKVKVLVSRIERIEHIDTPTEHDALLLENSLIKSLQPRYNILLKDDKTYPWIVVRNEPFPRVESTRRLVRDGSTYFGPYASVAMQRSMLEYAHSFFHLRTCRLDLSPAAIRKGHYKVCLQYHIGNCKGPCEGRQSEEEYMAEVELLKKHLRGDVRSTRQYLEEQMQLAAASLNFEVAARYKSRLALLDNYVSKSVIVSATLGNVDIFSLLMDEDEAYCNFVRVEQGAVTGSFTSRLSVGAESDRSEILADAISLVSERFAGHLAREVIVPWMPAEGLFEGVRFTVPKRGEKLALLEFSERSARLYRAERMKNMEIKNPERHTDRLMAAMRRELHLDKEPRHIECFDNSNNQGTYPVASCVVFRNGKPSRKEYRHFNIKSVEGPDDFASMREIVRRRYSRLLAEGSELPDLIIVDGGKGQLSSAYSVLQELGIADRVPIVGLAKRIEEIFFPNDPEPYYLDRTGEPLKVVMHLRNEAHRFGITFHRNKRSADFIHTELERIEGIGPSTIEKLLGHFSTISHIRRATPEEIAEVVGPAKADRIVTYFNKK